MTDINTAPDPADFSVNARESEFNVSVRFAGSLRLTVEASSASAVEAEVQRMIDSNEIEPMPEDLDQIDVEYARPCPAMYRVERDGRPMQVSVLRQGDIPREPDERGF